MAKKLIKHSGKGSTSEVLPDRHALTKLTAGDAYQRSISHYAKATPGLSTETPSVLDMAQVKY